MLYNIITLFSEMLKPFFEYGIISKAIKENKIEINLINLRDFGIGNYKKVDDSPYGGGAGMLLMCEPVVKAIESIPAEKQGLKILLSPGGENFNQAKANDLIKHNAMTLICGRYEGFDERILNFIDLKLNIGSYVLMGGELPALCVVEATARLLPSVLGNDKSIENESGDDFVEYPQFTKPHDFRGFKVPELLRSGDHLKIKEWQDKHKTKISG